MRIYHLSDLHIGKIVKNRSMLDEQKYILAQILDSVKEKKPDAVIIAGDVFDSAEPPTEAVETVGDFLTELCAMNVPTMVIAGNHDSAERLSFCSGIIKKQGIHIAQAFLRSGEESEALSAPITISDREGHSVNFYLLPYISQNLIERRFHANGEDKFKSYSEAMSAVVNSMGINKDNINALITHLFVGGSSLSGAEERLVGTLNKIGKEIFADFDYVALGHIHRAQSVSNRIRYCGSPLKYSSSECGQTKTFTEIELNGKEPPKVIEHTLTPLHDMVEVKGSIDELTDENKFGHLKDCYVYITLTDSAFGAEARLREFYPLLMSVCYEERAGAVVDTAESAVSEVLSPLEIFSKFYYQMKNAEPNDEQKKVISDLINTFGGNV